MLKAGVGTASGADSYAVGVEAGQGALLALGTPDADIFFVFASIAFDQREMLRGIRSVSGTARIVGSSTAGEIATQGPLRQHSVVVMALKSDTVKFVTAVSHPIEGNATSAGEDVARQIKQMGGEQMKLFMMIPDVLVGNGADVVRGVLKSLGAHFPVVGGASGDDFRFEKTYQYFNDTVYSGVVVGVGVTGNVAFGIGVKHGWVPVGLPKKVTKAEGSVLHELDGKPAIQIYEEYFGEERTESLRSEKLAKLAVTYPLGVVGVGDDEMLIRDPLSVDEHGSITCAAEVPEGSEVRLMIGSRDDAVKAAEQAAEHAKRELGTVAPAAIIIFNCIARNKLFGEQSGEEIFAIQRVLGNAVPLAGFYTYGEQAPLGGEVRNIEKCNPAFHNETVVICALGEASAS